MSPKDFTNHMRFLPKTSEKQIEHPTFGKYQCPPLPLFENVNKQPNFGKYRCPPLPLSETVNKHKNLQYNDSMGFSFAPDQKNNRLETIAELEQEMPTHNTFVQISKEDISFLSQAYDLVKKNGANQELSEQEIDIINNLYFDFKGNN